MLCVRVSGMQEMPLLLADRWVPMVCNVVISECFHISYNIIPLIFQLGFPWKVLLDLYLST